jgi:hypothetical protein
METNTLSYLLSFFFFFVLRFEPKVLNLLNRHSTTWAMLSAPFALGIFLNWVSLFCLGWPGLGSSYLCFLRSWYERCVPPHLPFYWLCWDLLTVCQGWPQISILQITTSWVVRVYGLSYNPWLAVGFLKGGLEQVSRCQGTLAPTCTKIDSEGPEGTIFQVEFWMIFPLTF